MSLTPQPFLVPSSHEHILPRQPHVYQDDTATMLAPQTNLKYNKYIRHQKTPRQKLYVCASLDVIGLHVPRIPENHGGIRQVHT